MHGKRALVFALRGELGAGKTTFVQGFLKGLGVRKRAPSPTFVIMRRYALPRAGAHAGKRGIFKNAFHVDAYRLARAKRHLAALGLGKILSDPENIILVEWADRAKGVLPPGVIWLTFRHGKNANERHIIIKRHTGRKTKK